MGCRAGITTRLAERKQEWLVEYPNMTNWKAFGPFQDREAAQAWEDAQTECDRSPGGDNPDDPNAEWFSYRFDFP
jgi:hypothetical protein